MAVRGIRLTPSVSRANTALIDGFRIRIVASDANNMTEKIFAYVLEPRNPNTGSQVGSFSHVCSPADIAEMPEDAPIPTANPAWYRTDEIDLFVRSSAEVDDLWTEIKSDVDQLIAVYARLDVLDVGDDHIAGTLAAESSSSSSSSSSGGA